jgi:hypothetical protein
VPEVLRYRGGLGPGSTVDVSPYGAGRQLVAVSRTARVRTVRGTLVAESQTAITDEDVLARLDCQDPPAIPRWSSTVESLLLQ